MTVFRCVRCNQPLTTALELLAAFPGRPEPVERSVASSTVARGHYALDPDPFGAPFVPNEDPHAPVSAMAGMTVSRGGAFLKSAGPRDTPVIHPEDAVGLHHHPDAKRWTGCCGPSGMYGRNLVCGCGRPVATLVADCLMHHELHLDPARVWADTGTGLLDISRGCRR